MKSKNKSQYQKVLAAALALKEKDKLDLLQDLFLSLGIEFVKLNEKAKKS